MKRILFGLLFSIIIVSCGSSEDGQNTINLQGEKSSGKVDLSWDGQGPFSIYRSVTANFEIATAELLVSSYTNSLYQDLHDAGGDFYYKIVGANDIVSNEVALIDIPPKIPSEFDVSVNNSAIAVSWSAVTGLTYSLYRSQLEAVDTVLENRIATGIDLNNFIDEEIVNDVRYYYVVVASNANNVTSSTAALSSLVPLTVVLSATNEPGGVKLSWNGSPPFNLYQDINSGFQSGPGNLIASNLATSSYTAPVPLGGNYYYKVVDSAGRISNEFNASNVPPSVPSNFAAQVNNGVVDLSWGVEIGLNYTVYRSTVSPVALITNNAIASGVSLASHADSTANLEQQYYYVVVANNQNGDSSNSSTQAVLVPETISLTATLDTAKVNLAWNGSPPFTIYRSTTSGVQIVANNIVVAGITATTYADTLLLGGNYYYKVVNANARVSNEFSALNIAPMAPTDFLATVNNGAVDLSWGVIPGLSYSVYRSTINPVATVENNIIASGPALNSHSDSNVSVEQQYHYVVIASNANGDTSSSTTQSATVPLLVNLSGNVEAGKVSLSWNGVAPFSLYRSATSGLQINASNLLASGLTPTIFTDNLPVGGSYYYIVVDSGARQSMEFAAANIPPAVPGNFVAQYNNDTVALSWNALAGLNYNLYRSTTLPVALISNNQIASGNALANHNDSNIVVGQTYYYVVEAVNQLALSTPSASQSVAIPVPSLTVVPLYPQNGAKWNDYIKRGQDVACVIEAGSDCVHAGAIRSVELLGVSSCAGISAEDNLQAFNWYCDSSTNPVKVISLGLKDNISLSDLIDATSAQPVFRNNAVLVKNNGTEINSSTPSTWWSNTLSFISATSVLDQASNIYIAKDNQGVVALAANNASLVFVANATANKISVNGMNHVWLEARVNAENQTDGVTFQSTNYSVIKNLKIYNALTYNMTLANCHNCRIENVVSANARSVGIRALSVTNSVLKNIYNYNNKEGILFSSAQNNTLIGISASHNGFSTSFGTGIRLSDFTNNNVFMGVNAIANRDQGVWVGHTPTPRGINDNIFSNILVARNRDGVVHNSEVMTQTYHNLITANNFRYGIWFSLSNNNTFTGTLKFGNPTDCAINSGTNPGIVSGSCEPQGTSDFGSAIRGISLENSFIGQVTNDVVNLSDSNGLAPHSLTMNWVDFDNSFRAWGVNTPFLTSAHRACLSEEQCRIWDWSIRQTDSIVLNVNSTPPTGIDTLTLRGQTFLRNAYEINLGPGDGDGLCESGETCLFTPNIGIYQGHGNLISAGTYNANGGLTNIKLYRYENSGR